MAHTTCQQQLIGFCSTYGNDNNKFVLCNNNNRTVYFYFVTFIAMHLPARCVIAVVLVFNVYFCVYTSLQTIGNVLAVNVVGRRSCQRKISAIWFPSSPICVQISPLMQYPGTVRYFLLKACALCPPPSTYHISIIRCPPRNVSKNKKQIDCVSAFCQRVQFKMSIQPRTAIRKPPASLAEKWIIVIYLTCSLQLSTLQISMV